MRGTVRRRGAGWEYQVDVGNQPAQRCPKPECCQERTWLVEERHERCPACAGPLEQRVERRLQSRAGFRTKREADSALRGVISAVEGGIHVAPTRQTVSDYLTDWLGAHASQVKASTLVSYRHSIERYVIPRIAGIQVQQLTPGRLTSMYAELAASGWEGGRPLSRRTVAYFHAILRKAFWGYPFNRSSLGRWITLAPACTIRGP